jgi:SlyX protein
MEQHITDLQSRLSFLEDTIDQLTRTAVEQQNRIVELEHALQELQEQLRAITPSDIDAAVDVKPPHY